MITITSKTIEATENGSRIRIAATGKRYSVELDSGYPHIIRGHAGSIARAIRFAENVAARVALSWNAPELLTMCETIRARVA